MVEMKSSKNEQKPLEKEIIGKNWFDNFLPGRIRYETKSVFHRFITGETDGFAHWETHVLTKLGEERIISWHNSILKDDEDNVIGILSSGEDITKNKQVEVRLREAEEKYKKLFETSPDVIILLNQDFNIIDINSTAEKIGCKSRNDVIDKYFGKEMVPLLGKEIPISVAGGIINDADGTYTCHCCGSGHHRAQAYGGRIDKAPESS